MTFLVYMVFVMGAGLDMIVVAVCLCIFIGYVKDTDADGSWSSSMFCSCFISYTMHVATVYLDLSADNETKTQDM